MPPQDFLDLAKRLASESSEVSWRSAISRAYYAMFHEVRNKLASWGFMIRQSDQAHAGLTRRLLHSGNDSLVSLGEFLSDLKRHRNYADYDLRRPVHQSDALVQVSRIEKSFQTTLNINRDEETKAVENIRRYESDVLREVTWQSPN